MSEDKKTGSEGEGENRQTGLGKKVEQVRAGAWWAALALSALVMTRYWIDVGFVPSLRLQEIPLLVLAVALLAVVYWGAILGVMLVPSMAWLLAWEFVPLKLTKRSRRHVGRALLNGVWPGPSSVAASDQDRRAFSLVVSSIPYSPLVLGLVMSVKVLESSALGLAVGLLLLVHLFCETYRLHRWLTEQPHLPDEAGKLKWRALSGALACAFGGLSFIWPLGIVLAAAGRVPGLNIGDSLVVVALIYMINVLPILSWRIPRLPAIAVVGFLLLLFVPIATSVGFDRRISWAVVQRVGIGNLPEHRLLLRPEGCEEIKALGGIDECPEKGVVLSPQTYWIFNRLGEKYWIGSGKVSDDPGAKCQNDTKDHLLQYRCFTLDAGGVADYVVGNPPPALAKSTSPQTASKPAAETDARLIGSAARGAVDSLNPTTTTSGTKGIRRERAKSLKAQCIPLRVSREN
jgi:hypothetical protein